MTNGYKYVPVEPTFEMVLSAHEAGIGFREMYRAAIATAPEPIFGPYKIAPLTPTDDMTNIGFDRLSERGVEWHNSSDVAYAYKAMLAAAPEQPSPTEPLDREAIRNAALEEAAVAAWNTGMDKHKGFMVDAREIGSQCASAIRNLKSQPAQPSDSQAKETALILGNAIYEAAKKSGIANNDHTSLSTSQLLHLLDCMVSAPSDSQAEVSDTEMLDWLESHVVNVRDPLPHGSLDMFWCSPEDLDGDFGPSDIRAKIKAAMQQEQS